MTVQAYLNQEFPLGLTDLFLHPVVVAEDPAEVQDEGVGTEARPACRPGSWCFTLVPLP